MDAYHSGVMSRTADRPGVVRLRALDARPRLAAPRGTVKAIIAANLPAKPRRKPRRHALEQKVLF